MNLSELQANQVELPIWQALAPLREALSRAHTSLLVAPPGAGKSTIVPLALLDEAWVQGRKILVLEPRRLAARALAWRMASLSGQPLGELVGLRTRDDTQVGPSTRIEILTEALLTRRIQHAPELEDVAVVIFDEFHVLLYVTIQRKSCQNDGLIELPGIGATALGLGEAEILIIVMYPIGAIWS